VAPLLTRAVSWPHSPKAAAPPPLEPTAAGAPTVAHLGSKRPAPDAPPEGQPGGGWDVAAEPPAAKRLREWRRGAEAAAGAGVLSVAETRIKVGQPLRFCICRLSEPGLARVWTKAALHNRG
jgi:hypothetical protein